MAISIGIASQVAAAVALALIFIATAIMALPTPMCNVKVVTMIVAAVYLGVSYWLLLGKPNYGRKIMCVGIW